MKKYTLRFRQADKKTFEYILKGKKRVETRAATSRNRNIKKGDKIIFICGKKKFEKQVKNSRIFKSVPAMLQKYEIKDIMPNLSSIEELTKIYYGYPGYREKIKQFGLIVLELAKNQN